MRSLFLVLLLANLVFAAALFGAFGALLSPNTTSVTQIAPERLRLVRPDSEAPQPSSGTKSR